jgi:hypothetical protein
MWRMDGWYLYSGIFHDGVWYKGSWHSYKLNLDDIVNQIFNIIDISNDYSLFENGVWVDGNLKGLVDNKLIFIIDPTLLEYLSDEEKHKISNIDSLSVNNDVNYLLAEFILK